MPATALATTFASESPFGTLVTQPTIVGVNALGTSAFNPNTAVVKVDGVALRTYLKNAGSISGHWISTETGPDSNGAYRTTWTWIPDSGGATMASVYAYPMNPYGDGVHSVSVAVSDATTAATTYTDSWTFNVEITPTFGAPSPAASSTVGTSSPTISIPVADNSAVTHWDVSVNGTATAATLSGGVLTLAPTALPNDATSTVDVTIYDAAGNHQHKTWSFGVEIYPPMAGTTADCASCHPGFEHDRTMGTPCNLCHSGTYLNPHPATVAPVTYHANATLGTGCRSCHVSALLSEHARHGLVCATCHLSTDPSVVSAIQRGDSTCTACHSASDHLAVHDTTVDAACAECHTNNLVNEHVTNRSLTCDTCHSSSDPSVVSAISSGNTACSACHSVSGGQAHAADHHPASVLSSACASCHTTDLQTEHITVRGLSCATCHSSGDSRVIAAISSSNSECSSCHDFGNLHSALGMDTLHSSAPASGDIVIQGKDFGQQSCGSCHDANVLNVHSNDCTTCHPQPYLSVGMTWNRSCVSGGCHTPSSSAPMHAGIDAAHNQSSASDSCKAVGCHDASAITPFVGRSLADLHSNATTTVAGVTRSKCQICHYAGATLTSNCLTAGCHPERALPHGYDAATHTGTPTATTFSIGGVTYPAVACSTCHSTELGVEHTKPTSAGNTGCLECHASLVSQLPPPWNRNTCAQGGCHTPTSAAPQHAQIDSAHVRLSANSGCVVTGCHADGSLAAIHSQATTTVAGVTRTSCAVCHADGVPTSADCTSCHPEKVASHYDTTQHAATLTSADVTILGTDFGTQTCSACHPSGDLRAVHGGGNDCATCHPTAAAAATPWNGSCSATGCHAAGSSQPMHANIDSAHTIAPQTCTADGCHPGAGNIAAIHSSATTTTAGVTLTSCQICHAAGRTPSTNCTAAGCHANMNGHGDVTTVHAASISSGYMSLFNDGSWHNQMEGSTGDVNVDCTMCHQPNLLTVHGNDCSLCHFGSSPARNSFTTWNQSCTQGACHADGFHASMSDAHDQYVGSDESGSCDCHNYVDYTSDTQQATSAWCSSCHAIGSDTTPPTTTSNVLASYIGTASIGFDATDIRSVKWTKYVLDSGATTTVTGALTIAPPASGTQSHVLTYWSSDWAGNVEVPHTALFTVRPDTTPPVTSSDATAAYAGPATIHLVPTDDGTDYGTAGTYFRVDGGATQAGTTILVPQPSSGVASHTIDFWSVDFAGNIETAKHVAFTVTADLVAPSTTTNLIAAPAKYYGPGYLYIYLYPTDPAPASGIAHVYVTTPDPNGPGGYWTVYGNEAWSIGNGTYQITTGWYAGTHTIKYWSVDNAGNAEATKTATFTVDGTAPVTTTDIHSPYNGPATVHLSATDDLSGVAQTNWYVSGMGWNVGNTVNLPAPSSGSTTYYLWYYSTDNVGNNENYHVNVPITVNALVDNAPPFGSMSVNNGSIATSSTAVTINSSVTDTGTGVAQMRVDPGTGTYGGWVTYSANYGITMPSGDGTKTINVQYRDSAPTPNVSAVMTYKIRLDTVAPTGTMSVNNNATWASTTTVSVNSTVTDAGSGVASMSIDPGTGTYGPWIAYAASSTVTMPTGDGTKTVRVKYEDFAGVVLSLSDTIILDATPPSGVMSINNNAAYTGTTAVSVNSTVTDTGSGLAQMRVDSGSGYGSWVAYAASTPATLLSGDGTKTVNVQYRDNAGGIGTLTDTIVLDANAPVTTSDAVASYPGTATVHLSASDAGSGVKATYFKLDGGAQTTGTVVTTSVQGSHTLQFWSVDYAGLKETTKTANFTVTVPDTIPPTTTSNAAASYIGTGTVTLSAVDTGGSGVKATYYKLDGGAQTTGTVVLVGGVGTHTLEFWSVDNAGNAESPHNSVSIQIIAGQAFAFTGADQYFTVPAGVTSVNVDLYGGAGGDLSGYDAWGGNGGYVHATVPVTAGQVLDVKVGGKAGDWSSSGAWPNGGNGDGDYGSSGGGSSLVALGSTVLVEAGGGGGAGDGGYNGGDGGWDAAYPIGGNQRGGDSECGGGGGWLGGAANDNGDEGSADGGASFINVGYGTMIAGMQAYDGSVQITYPGALTSVDHTAPVTTSSAVASYTTAASISLVATDPSGWGVRSTYYNLDGAGITAGNQISVLANGSHTLQFWSVDNAGNAETPHTVNFTVSIADIIAPMTTNNAAAGYAGTATVTLSAADDVPNGSGVASTHYRLDGGADTIGTTVVAGASGSHTIEYWSVDVAGNIETHRFVTFVIDRTAPVTTSDAKAAYPGTATVTLSATDASPSAGLWYTFYKVDGGGTYSRVAPTSIVISAAGTHTIEFWSQDAVGNVETHHVVTLLVDKVAPVTASNAVASYTGTATISLTASDTGGSGVSATYYRLDTGVTTTGTTVVVAAPGSGSVGHTLYFWSVDVAGNVEATKSASFTSIAPPDVTPPVTTSNAAAGYNTTATISLTATDTGSGVKATYFKLDGGATTTGTVITTGAAGSHTLQFWSVDNSNNKETTKTATFVLDFVAPVTTSDAQTSYVGTATITLSPSDSGGSGVATTVYRDGLGGTDLTGTKAVIAPPDTGSATHMVYFHSVDVAGNREATKSATFAVVAAGAGNTVSGSATFSATGTYQTFTVPNGVYQLTVDAKGAQGGAGWSGSPGLGGRVRTVLAVAPGQVYTLVVGTQGDDVRNSNSGGFADGGWGDSSNDAQEEGGGGGGGATQIWLGSATTLEAGGGGAGGEQTDGGDGGWIGSGTGGGRNSGTDAESYSDGGGGGGGWDGGIAGTDYQGGQGGSSWVSALHIGVPDYSGTNEGDGSIALSW